MSYRNIIRIILYGSFIIFTINYFRPYNIVDPSLKDYDNKYLEIVNKYCTKKQYLQPRQKAIYFQDLGEGRIANCTTNGHSKMTIKINPKYWNDVSWDQQWSTAVHELNHCYLNMDHSPDPNSVMYAYENFLTKEEVTKQLIEILKEHCK